MSRQNAEVGRDASSRELVGASLALRTAGRTSPLIAVAGTGLPSLADEASRSPLSPTAAYYAEALGWPVAMDADSIVVECGSTVNAFAMPAALGSEVSHLLGLHRIYVPVVEVRGGGRPMWVFLCEPRRSEKPTPSLVHHGVEHFGDGARVPLPLSAASGAGSPRWILRPNLSVEEPLPPWMAVLSCVLTAIRR